MTQMRDNIAKMSDGELEHAAEILEDILDVRITTSDTQVYHALAAGRLALIKKELSKRRNV